MRRLLIPSCLLLMSCVQPGDIAPEEVLRLSSAANREVSAAKFVVDGSVNAGLPEDALTVNIRSDGRLRDGGKQSSFSLSLRGEKTTGETVQTGVVEMDAIVVAEREAYLRIRSLVVDPPHEMLSSPLFAQLQNTWLRLPIESSQESVTPDPRMLRLQTDIVKIVADRGFDTVNGKRSRRLDVTIDPEKLQAFMGELSTTDEAALEESLALLDRLSFEGTLWIDARTHVLNVAEWRMQSTDEQNPLDVRFSIEITEDDESLAIAPPSGAITLPFLPVLGGENGLFFPQNGVMDQNAPAPRMQEQLMESSEGNR